MLADVKLLSPVHTGDKVEFNTVDFVESRLCRFGPVHTGNKVDRIGKKVKRIGNKVDRDKLSNSRCCRFVAKTGNKVDRIGDSRRFVASFSNNRLCRQCVPGFIGLRVSCQDCNLVDLTAQYGVNIVC